MTAYYGQPGDIDSTTPAAAVNIASSTFASPTVVTTSGAHGLQTGMTVIVNGHTTNTNANGIRLVIVLSSTTFRMTTLGGTAVNGNGIGGATGTVQSLAFPGVTLPEDAVTDIDAASVNVPLEGLADMTAWLAYKIMADLSILTGGSLSTASGAPATFNGEADFNAAVTASNTTADPGIEATGGAGAAGLAGIGGAGGAPGVTGTGTTNTAGVQGFGNGTAAGVQGTGGASSGAGVSGTGGNANGAGVIGQGNGTGDGVVGVGGSSSGDGGQFTGGATNGVGVRALGAGTGAGVVATGGVSNGNGATATGTGTGVGLAAQGGATGKGITCASGSAAVPALDVGVGNQVFTGTATASGVDPGANDYLCGANVCKAWARIQTDMAGNASVLDGYNVSATVAVGTTDITVTFMRAMASANYAPTVSSAAFAGPRWAITDTQTTTTVKIRWIDAAGATVNPSTEILDVSLVVMARQ